jgi:hypothetical protein
MVMDSVKNYGGFQKIDSRSDRVFAVGALIVSYLGIIMRKTQSITRLRVVSDAQFNNVIFGVEAARTVLDEIYKKYIFVEQRRVFMPWKIL